MLEETINTDKHMVNNYTQYPEIVTKQIFIY
jgi:hypothetical protein